jgi:hypothetical protein
LRDGATASARRGICRKLLFAMRILGLLLLLSGWLIVVAAVILLLANARAAFVAAGIAVELLGLGILARSHLAHHGVRR